MKYENINPAISQNIAITTIVLTAARYLAGTSIIKDNSYISNFYGLSFFMLILCYIIYSKISISTETYNLCQNILLSNLFCTSSFLALSMNIFNFSSHTNTFYPLLLLSIFMSTLLPIVLILLIVLIVIVRYIGKYNTPAPKNESISGKMLRSLLGDEDSLVKTVKVVIELIIIVLIIILMLLLHTYYLALIFILLFFGIIYRVKVTIIKIKSSLEPDYKKKHRQRL